MEALFLTKYSFEDKRNAVAKYINENKSAYEIMNETGINIHEIYGWIKQYKANGISGLAVKHSRKNYNVEFKKLVVDYYLNNMEGPTSTAAKFRINPSQVYQWVKLFKEHGIRGLKPSPKGRPSKMVKKKKQKKVNKDSLSLTEREKYEEEILNLKSQRSDLELENAFLKAFAQIKAEPTDKRQKR
jgi:transposase